MRGEGWTKPVANDDAPERLADWGSGMTEIFAKLGETALASSQVVGERMGLAMTALADPEAVDHGEFTLMATEKIEGFTAAFNAVIGGLSQLNYAMAQGVAEQAASFSRVAVDCGTAHHPFDILAAQHRWFSETMATTSRQTIRVANGLGSLPASALDPLHSRVTDNARRLGTRAKV